MLLIGWLRGLCSDHSRVFKGYMNPDVKDVITSEECATIAAGVQGGNLYGFRFGFMVRQAAKGV